jgi:hypothetical protein
VSNEYLKTVYVNVRKDYDLPELDDKNSYGVAFTGLPETTDVFVLKAVRKGGKVLADIVFVGHVFSDGPEDDRPE